MYCPSLLLPTESHAGKTHVLLDSQYLQFPLKKVRIKNLQDKIALFIYNMPIKYCCSHHSNRSLVYPKYLPCLYAYDRSSVDQCCNI